MAVRQATESRPIARRKRLIFVLRIKIPPLRPAPRDRWLELANLAVKPGWVVTQDFCRVFKVGVGNIVHGAARVNKRLRENGEDLENRKTGGRGPPLKMCRISALKRAYRDLA